jgi:hypothetical protein
VFRRYQSQPVDRVMALINPVLRGWEWVLKLVHLPRARGPFARWLVDPAASRSEPLFWAAGVAIFVFSVIVMAVASHDRHSAAVEMARQHRSGI